MGNYITKNLRKPNKEDEIVFICNICVKKKAPIEYDVFPKQIIENIKYLSFHH